MEAAQVPMHIIGHQHLCAGDACPARYRTGSPCERKPATLNSKPRSSTAALRLPSRLMERVAWVALVDLDAVDRTTAVGASLVGDLAGGSFAVGTQVGLVERVVQLAATGTALVERVVRLLLDQHAAVWATLYPDQFCGGDGIRTQGSPSRPPGVQWSPCARER